MDGGLLRKDISGVLEFGSLENDGVMDVFTDNYN
jgi:hypothetical protein